MFSYEDYEKSASFIRGKMGDLNPKIAIILGSGLGVLSNEFEQKIVVNYKEIPNFPESTVEWHAGELIIGKLNGVEIIAMNGRFHYYEGYDIKQTTFPIRVFKLLGVEKLIITNASGGINTGFNAGDFMVINDYLSFFARVTIKRKKFRRIWRKISRFK